MSGLIGKLRGEIHGSEQHAGQLERELQSSHAHAQALQHRLRALEHAAAHVDHSKPVPRHGIDYAWHPTVDAHALRAAGVTFALRYLGPPGGDSKGLTASEARALSAAGIDVAVIYETTGNTAGGRHAGEADAHRAKQWAQGILPTGRPVYFTNDREPTDGLLDYLAGAAAILGHHAVGVYGGLQAIERAAGANACAYHWQTLAWSDGRWSPHAQLRQTAVNQRVAGVDCDLDEARAADFGQWRG